MQYYLTKSKYLSGLQCHKRLWNKVRHPKRATDTPISQQRRMNQGTEVGILAHDDFPGGVLIDAMDPLVSVEQTEKAIKRGASCIFEATFIFNGVLVKCDIFQKDADSWRIVEVKSSTVNRTVRESKIIKEEHLHDLAIQKYVLTGYGLSISKTQLMLINSRECFYPDLSNLFIIQDATDQVDELMDDVESNVEAFKTVLDRDDEPQVLIGEHCEKPYRCPFKEYCWEDVPEKSTVTIPGLRWNEKNALIEKGIFRLEDVPVDYSLTPKQWTYVNSVLHNKPAIDNTAIQQELASLECLIHFLDFETDNPPIPRFDGLRPRQQFPFQYSCHVLHADGALTHHEYLHTDMSDPREPLLESLLNHVSDRGSVVVYRKATEEGVLKDLAIAFPKHAARLQSIIDRLWDQLVIFQKHYTHPDFGGSSSLKRVLPVLVPSLCYDDLDVVQDGLEAQAVWDTMIRTTDETEKSKLIRHLKEYCELDTLATVEIHKVLCAL